MCGICGEVTLDPRGSASGERLRTMCARMVHRGPDDEGLFIEGPAALGARRLSIIDLAGGHQPLSNEDGTVWVAQNGEIYNYAELARGLEARGHHLRTHSDTEVLAHLYEEEGDRFVERLDGMFAIAVWDVKRRRLLLARDRLGIKPLVYGVVDGERLVFASELQAILPTLPSLPPVDPAALHDYLSLNYIPAPATIYQGLSKLLPGHLLLLEDGRVTTRAYWDLHYPEGGSNGHRRERDPAGRLREELRSAVRRHLVSDVPVGVLLSGGIDSGGITAIASELTPGNLETFSVGFHEPSYNELPFAREVARRYGTRHHEVMLEPPTLDLLERLARQWGEPYADSSAVPLYAVSRLAASRVKVVLTGDGGDEIFAGYETYAAAQAAESYRRLPALLRDRAIPALVNRLPVSDRKISLEYKAKRFVRGAGFAPEEAHYQYKVLFDEAAKRELYAESVRGAVGEGNSFETFQPYFGRVSSADLLNRLLYVDAKVYLPGDILAKADSMSMAHSLEARPPLLDHHLVEFAAALPLDLKVHGLKKKVLLRKAVAPLLPARIVRARKKGFNVPAARWIRRELHGAVEELLSPAALEAGGFFRPGPVRRLLEEHRAQRADYSREIWGLMMFTLWQKVVGHGSTAAA